MRSVIANYGISLNTIENTITTARGKRYAAKFSCVDLTVFTESVKYRVKYRVSQAVKIWLNIQGVSRVREQVLLRRVGDSSPEESGVKQSSSEVCLKAVGAPEEFLIRRSGV